MKTPTTQPLSLPVRLTRSLRTPIWKKTVSSILLAQFALWSVQVKGATYDWDPAITGGVTLGGAGTWNTSNLNWWNGTSDIAWPNTVDTARFGGTMGGLVTLGSAINVGGLIFNTTGYNIAGGVNALTLAGTGVTNIAVNEFGTRTTIDAQLSGTSGLTKTGNGVLTLTNNSNNFTGNVLVNQGALVVTNQAQLGSGNLVSVNGFSAPNFTGGQLVIQGGVSGLTFSKNLSLAGRGINLPNSSTGALLNVGQNTFTGNVTFSNASATTVLNSYGNATYTGTINVPTGNLALFTGSGNTIVSGLVTGGSATTDRFGKGGGFTLPSTLWLQNANNNYVSDTRIDGGTVRVSTSAALGLQGATATSIDLLNGGIEILTDSPDFSNKTVQVRDFASGTTFVSRALGGSGLNQTVVFGATRGTGAGTTLNVNGRDGYNTTFGNGVANFTGGGGGNAVINNNSSGTLTINSPNIWNQTDATARTITFQGNGDIVATGNILATGGLTNGSGHVFAKLGTGAMTIQGTASTFAGQTNLSAGTLNISTIGALNANSTGRINFGGGTLNYTGAGETWTNKVLLLNAGNSILTNNGSGALVLPQNVGNNGTGAKNLVLGGANAGVNDLQGIVTNTTVGAGLTKIDSGNWQISSPGTTATTIGAAGSITVTANATTSQTVTMASTSGLVVGQPISGGAIPFGTVISQIISSTQFAISQTAVITTPVVLGTVTGSIAAFTPTAAAANVLTTATANLVIGQPVVSAAMPASQGWFISAISGTTITVANTTGAAALVGAAGLVSTTPSASANFAGPLTIAGGAVTLNPLSGTAEVINNSSNVVFAADPIRGSQFAGGTLNYKGFTTGSTEVAGILVPTAGAGRIVVTPGTSGSTNLNFGSLGTRGASATLNFAPGTVTGIQFMAAPAGLNGQLGGYAYITNPATGSIDYVATPTANTNITALAAATAFPTITGAATTNYIASAGTTTTTGAVAANTVRLAGGSIVLGGNLTITSTSATALGGILHDNTAGATGITGAFGIAPSTAGQELVVITGGATPANALTVGSNITGTGSVTKAGSGTLILSGVNTFTNALNLNEGTLRASGTSASILGIPAAATVNTTRQGTTLDINAAGASGVPYTAIPALTAVPILISAPIVGSGNITTTAAGDQFIQLGAAGSTSATAILSGVISNGSGTVSVIKNGAAASIQALTGLNTYTGATIISGGMIQANTLANGGFASSIGASTSAASNLIFNGGILQYTGATAQIYQQTQTPSTSIDRLFTLAGNGTIDSSGSFGANTLVRAANNAALIFNNTGSVAFAGAGTRSLTLQGDSTGDNEFRTLIGNNPNAGELTSLTKAGSGLWIVSGANTYSGATTISAGALQGVDGVGLPTTSNLTLNGGVFQSSGTFTRVLGTGANQVQFGASGGGFSASSAKLTVNLSTGAPLVFGAAPIAGSTLILSSTTALSDVEVVNPLTLGTAARTVQVDDNANSNFDFATLSGVISGAAGGNLTKTGGGTLILNGANDYIGSTTLSGGNVIVQSIGAAGATATSLGTNVGGGALNIGSSGAAGSIIYVGSGETTTRAVNIAGTTGGATIDSSGSGALVLNNVAVTGAGAKTLTIRGVNLDANRISSNLNDNGGILSVTKNDSGIWELTGTNGFTGTLNISGGLLGVNSAAALGASGSGSIEFNNGGLYSTGGALTIARAIRIGANNSAGFTGPGAFTLSNTVTLVNGNPWTINNTISDPAGLSISGNFVSQETVGTNRTLTLAGTGNYNLSGVIQPSGGGIQLTVNTANTATTTISGGSPNLMSATGELRQGILILDKAQALGLAATTFDLNGGELRTSTTLAAQTQTNIFRLNGSVALINGSNPLIMSGSLGLNGGSRTLQNDISSPSGLTISGPINLSVDGTITARTLTLSGSGTTNISGIIRNDAAAGAVASSVTYSGSGALNLNGAVANSWTGTAIFNGGTTTVSSGATLGSTGALTVNQAILTLDNTGTSVGARLGNRATTLNGATLNFLGNAAGTTELSTGALTIGTGGTTINNVNIGGNSILTFGSLVATAAGSSVNFTGGVGTATNQVTFTAAPTLTPATTGILARATVAGADFATYGANGITAFTGYTNPADLNGAAATDTVRLNATTTIGALTTNKTVNALAFNAGAPTVSNSTGTVLTVTTGGILTTGAGPYTISARTNLGAEGALHVNTGSTLNINGVLSGAAGLTKNLGGALNLNAANFITGTTTVNGGTTTLSGGLNTLFPGQTLVVNPTATLDLNGNSQYVQAFGGGNNPGTGGTITSAGAALFSNNGSVAFGGNITGAITMNKTGGNTLTAESPLAYTGDTWITGGTLTLRDNATLLNTAAITINYGTLNLDSNANLQIGNNNRVSDTAPITSRGGTITYQARFQAAGTETLGALSLGEGASTINVNAANNSGNNTPFLSAELTLASLTRSAGATVNINSNLGLGIAGNNNRLFFTAAPTTLANNMIGAWAIANNTDYAAYDPTLGVGVFGYSGYAPYAATFGSGNVTQFINNTTPTTTSISAATTTTGALRLGGVSLNDITFTAGTNTLVLESGGLLRSNQAAGSSIGTTATRGVLTAGTGSAAELVIYSAAAGTTTSAATATTTSGSPVITTVPSTVGLAPGQTITNANFPAGTYIVSIDSPTQITVSQNATANGAANQALVTGRDNVVINSVIANNGAGVVTLVKSGAGVLNLSANNTYTGGTILNQSTVNLIGSGVVIPAGGITLNGATLALNTNAGQIAATNAVTMNDSSTLTLVGANTLNSINFNNSGGTGTPTVTTGGILTLTNSTPLSVVSNNLASVPIVNGTLDFGSGAKTISVGAIQIGGTTLTNIAPALSIAAPILSPGASITKTGNGFLQLSGASTFGGGLSVSAGGIVIGASSTPATGVITSGPLGTGSVTMAAGTTFLSNSTAAVGNPISFAGTPTFDSTATTAWTLTFNGALSGAGVPGGTLSAAVNNPGLTVALLGNLPAFSTVNKTGSGTLIFNATNYTGDFNATALGNPNAVSLLADGNGTGQTQTLLTGSNVIFDAGIVPNITVGRAGGFGGSSPFILSANKVMAPVSISNLGLGLTVTNGAGDGLRAADSFTTTGTPTYTVGTATVSNVTQGLELTGAITAAAGFNKAGAGTLILGNTSNSIGAPINVTQGVLSISSLAQLGGAQVNLNPSAGTSTLRVTSNITGSPAIQLTNTANTRAIEVTSGNTLQLNSAFDVSLAAAAGLTKADAGTLAINANNSTWTGALTISQGAVNVLNAGALGTTGGNTIVGGSGAALLLPAGTSIAEPLSLNGSGIQSAGALQGTGAGTSTESGAITLAAAAFIGADSGNTLSLTGGISGAQALTFAGAGNISLTTTALGAVSSVTKIGSGTTTLGVASTGFVGGLTVNNGTFLLNSAGTLGATGTITVNPTGTFTVDNTTSPVARLGARPVTLAGGTLNYNTNSAAPFTETAGVLTLNQGQNTINLTNAGGSLTTTTFASLAFGAGASGNVTGLNVATSQLKFTAAPALTPVTVGILPRLTVGGNEFATYSATNGVVPYTGYAAATNILTVAATQTFRATSATANSLTGNATINALTLSSGPLVGNVPNVGGLGGNPPTTLTLTSGAILATGTGAGVSSTLSVPIVALAAVEGVIHVASGQTLNVSSSFSGTAGMTKALAGTLNLNSQQYVSGNTVINAGTLNLASGVTNTLLFNNGVAVNAGGTLNLNGSSQFIAGLSTQTGGAGTDLGGGTVTNTGALSTLTINSATNFGGVITGAIHLNKTGTGSLNFQAAQTYTGSTLITGGTVALNDSGALPNTSQPIEIRHGSLQLTDANLVSSTNRVSDTAPITLTGGTIGVTGRAQSASSETFGAVTLAGGHNQLNATAGGTGINSLDVTYASLSRSDTSATLRFNTTGQIGSAARILITSAPTLTNNIIGAWAVSDREFASYDSTYGVGRLNDIGFANHSTVGLTNNPTASDNVRFNAAGTTTLAANTTVNTLTFGQQATATVLNLGGNTLTLAGGGLLFGQLTDNVDFSITNGSITSGVLNTPSDFFIHKGSFGGTNRTATIAAPIVNNGTGAVRAIFAAGQIEASGVGNTILTAVNTYTGGTIINSGNVVIGTGGALGTGGVTVNNGFLVQSVAGVGLPSQALTLNGGGVVTLAGNNSITDLTFNNNGGAQPTLNPTGVLTLTGGTGITASVSSPGTISTIAGGTVDLNANGTYPISVGAAIVNGVDVAPWQAGLNITSLIQNGGISKSGAGVLQLSAASNFTGGVNVTAGGLIIGSDTNSLLLNDPVVTGPVGTGTLTMSANTTLLAGGAARTITNNVTFLGDTVFNGINNLTLNGTSTLPSIWNATVTAPQMTVTIGNASPSISSDVINKSGLGTLNIGFYAGTINIVGGLIFNADGNTLGTQESINLGGNVVLTGDTAVTVNRSGGAPNARNKVLQKVDLTTSNILSVSNLNGYGLEFTGTTNMTGVAHFAVGTATASNVVQGLTLSGVVTDSGSNFNMIKSGPGTLALTNAGNTFGGSGSNIDVLGGVLSVNSDGALGAAGNGVILEVDGSSGSGFRSTGTFSTSRTFQLAALNNAFEVTAGNVLTLATPFTFSAATNALFKNDNGILELSASNSASSWSNITAGITINAGAVRLSNSSAAGLATNRIIINQPIGAGLQLSGGVTVANPLVLNNVSNEPTRGGLNSAGNLQSVSGSNTYSGSIATVFDAVIGANTGSTLSLTGGIDNTGGRQITFTGGGVINLSSAISVAPFQVNKYGAGTVNFTTAQTVAMGASTGAGITINAGTVSFNQDGRLNLAAVGGLNLNPGSTLEVIDNSTLPTNNRLGTSAITLRGGNLSIVGSTTGNTSETLAAPTFSRGYSVVTVTAGAGQQANLAFNAAANNVAPAQNAATAPSGASVLFRGSSLGTAAGAGVATIANSTGGFTFNGQTGATGTTTKGILPWALVDTTAAGNGTSFATTDAAAGTGTAILRPLAAGEYTTSNTFSANNNIQLTTGTTSIGAATLNVNSLTIAGNAGVTINPFLTLTSSSGGILVRSGSTSTISGGILSQINTASPFNIWTVGNLTISSLLNGGNGTANGNIGFVKAGAGSLTLSTPTSSIPGLTTGVNTMSGQTVINQGTVVLNGGTNTIQANNFLSIQGGTLDLNGNSQQVLSLFTDGFVSGAGGVVTSSVGTGQLIVNQDNAPRNWAGSIQGSVNFTRSGQNTMTIYSPQTYTGATLINGGTTTLRDSAALTGTGALDINYATLSADNNAGLNDLTDRINDSKAITLRGGTLTIQGRAQTASSEALGSVSVNQGFNVLNPNVGGTGVNSIDVSIASLSRPAGSSATFIVQGNNLGTIGSNSRVTVGTLNGVATTNPTYSRNGSGLTQNLVGPWAINGSDFLTYIPGLGLAPLNQVGAPQYDLTNTFIGADPTDNIRLTVTSNITLGGVNANAVSMSGSAINLNFLGASDILNITSGGLIGPNNNQTIGTTLLPGIITAGGPTPSLTSDLYIYNRVNTLTINSRISDNTSGGGSAVRSIFTASGGAITLVNPANSYTGGTVLNGGTLNLTNTAATAVIPAGGLEINNGTVTMNNFAGQINAANVVTLNSAGSNLNLWGDNTLAGLVANNIGGGAGSLQINTFSQVATSGAAANGVLTIGASGIVATQSNAASQSIIVGRTDFGATAKTVQVAPIIANGVEINPLQAGFVIQGIVGTSGGITKTGTGVLQFNAQAHYTGPTTVNAGGIRIGVTNGGSRYSALTLNGANTLLNLAGASTVFGSLAGSGTVFNSGGAATLTVGSDNTSTTFSGQLSRFNDATLTAVALTKIGTGTLSLTGAQSFTTGTTGAITVNGGGLTYTGAGAAFPATTVSGGATINVNNGGTLTLSNTASNLNNRLGMNVAGTFNLQGGTLALAGNSGANTSETITTFNVTNGGGRIEFTPNAATSTGLTITTLNTANGTGSLVVGGIDGSAVGTANKGTLTITTPNFFGSQGGGNNGTTTMSVRHDILGDASVGGLGTGFLVRDTAVGGTYRALAAGELASAFALPLTTDVDLVTAGNQAAGTLNVGLGGTAATIGVNTVANTLTMSGTTSVSSNLGSAFGVYGPGGNLLTTSLSNAAASLTLAGATATINTAFGSTVSGTTPFVHVIAGGTLNVNGAFAVNGTAGIAKADGGILNLNAATYYTGATTINGGTVNLSSGAANTIAVVPTAAGASASTVNLNGTGATLNLNGQNQVIGNLASINVLPGQGGTVTSSSAAVLTSIGGGNFGGALTGSLSFTRAGNNTTLLTNANTYSGATIVRGGILQLRDAGTISSTAGLTLNYGTLNWDNFGLNPNGTPNLTRVAAGNAVTMQGGAFNINGAGSTDTTVTLNSVTVTGGNNTFNVLPYVNMGGTVKLTIGNLLRNTTNRSGVNFNGFTTNNAGTGVSALGGQGLTQNGNVIINQINGSNFAAANLTNNLIGGWAVADGSTFATYVDGFGVSVMGQTTQGIVAPGFTGTDLSLALVATGNYSDGGAARTLATGAVVSNSWRFVPGAAQTITFPTTTTATLGVGMISNAGFLTTLAATDASNTISGSAADLYFYINQNVLAIEPSIVGSTAVISNGPATLRLAPKFANNTYSGGTFVQNGTLNLSATSPFIAVPGDLTATNAAVTMSTVTNQIATTSNVFINGGGSVTLPNYTTGPTQTLNSLTFTNDGGNAAPTFSLGTPTTAVSTLVLSSATPITSTNNSPATTPTISTGAATLTALQFSNANPVITVTDGLAETELTISAPITQNAGMTGPLAKTGTGVLALSGASTFTTGFNLNQGGLMFGANSTGSPTVTSGPVGTGTLTIAGGTSLLSDNTIRTIGNATTVTGDFTFAGPVAGNGVILSGAMALGATGRTITVTSPAVTSTISGAITSTATGTAVTKAGLGTLVFTSASNSFNGAAVAVTGGILKNGIDNAIPTSSAVAVSAGAGYDLNNFNQTVDGISGTGFITQSVGNTRTLTVSSTTTNSTFNGVITDNNLGLTNSRLDLVKVGTASTLTLGGANSYIGTTTVTSGILSITNALALGTTTNGTIVSSGGSLQLSNNITVGAEALTITGTGSATNGALRNLSGNNTYSGTVTIGTGGATITSDAGLLTLNNATAAIAAGTNGVTFAGAGNTTVTTPITGTTATSTVTKTGAGTATFSGTNTYAGQTAINGGTLSVAASANLGNASATNTLAMNGGTLQITAGIDLGTNRSLALGASGGTIDVATAPTTTVNLPAAISGTGGLTKSGAGILDLNGSAANTFSGLTTVSAGTLQLSKTGGATAIVGDGVNSKVIPDVLINGGTLKLIGDNQLADSVYINMTSGVFNVNGRTDTIFWFTNSGGTYLSPRGSALTVTDPTWSGGTNDVFGNDTYGNLIIAGGTNIVHGAEGFGIGQNGSLTVGSGGLEFQGSNNNLTLSSDDQSAGVLNLNGNVSFTGSAGTATITSGQALQSDGVTPAVSQPGTNQGTVNLGASTRTFTIANGSAAIDMSISARVTGTGGLTKDGAGLMVLSGANTYTGNTTVAAGTLSVSAANNLGASTNSIALSGGGTLLATGSFDAGTSRTVALGTGGGNISATSGNNVTISGVISGSDALTFGTATTGTGIVTLTGNNANTGTVTVAAGQVLANNATSSTGSGAVTVSNTGTILGGSGTIAGDLTVNAGALIAPGGAANTAGTLTIGGSTVVINGSGVPETRLNFDYTNATGNVPGLSPAGWAAYSGPLLTGTGLGGNDLLNFGTTSLTWNTGGKISLNQIGAAYTWLQGDVFNLLDWTALSDSGNGIGVIGGTFDSSIDFNLPALGGGLAWDTSRFVTTGAIAVVPEPGRALLMLFGLMALFFRRRRQD